MDELTEALCKEAKKFGLSQSPITEQPR